MSLKRLCGFFVAWLLVAGAAQGQTWTSKDVGSVGATGTATVQSGLFTVAGSGTDIGGTADAFQFYYQSLSGDGEVIARVASVPTNNAWSKAGVVIRESLNANAKNATVVVSRDNGIQFMVRKTTGGTATSNLVLAARTAPQWVKLIRSGTTCSAYTSRDNATWELLGTDTVSMATTVYIGLAVTSHVNTALGTATFDNVSVIPGTVSDLYPPQPPVLALGVKSSLSFAMGWSGATDDVGIASYEIDRNGVAVATVPATTYSYVDNGLTPSTAYIYAVKALDASGKASQPSASVSGTTDAVGTGLLTASQDIGVVGITGTTTYVSGSATYIIQAAGSNIWGTADSFRFGYQPCNGDTEIVARVASLLNGGGNGGVMIRESLNPNSAEACISVTYSSGIMFESRSSTGASASYKGDTISGRTAPQWVKLARHGNAFKGYTSIDGVNWQYVGGDTIAMASAAYAGLATAAQSITVLRGATFTNVDICAPVDSQAPTAPSGFNLYSLSDVSLSVSWTPSNDDTAVDGYDIFQDGVQIGTTPYARFTGTFLTPGTSHIYTVESFDAAGNLGVTSGTFSATLNQATLPTPWVHNDLGSIDYAGGASLTSGTFGILGAGVDIWDVQDSFHYVYQPLNGNATITARVVSMPNSPNTLAKSGVMIRETLDANARNVMFAVRSGSAALLQWRTTPGATTSYSWGNQSAKTPYWVRLVRGGSLFAGYQSADGINWTLAASGTVTMGTNAYIGLAVTSHTSGTLALGVFDAVQISTDSDGNGLPDGWELTYFGQIGVDPNALAPRGDGLTNLQAYQQGLNPVDYYNGIAPTVTQLRGDNQNGIPNGVLPQSFSIGVTGTDGSPLVNAPVTVTVQSGGGLVSTSGSAGATSMAVRTDANGQISFSYQEGSAWSVTSKIKAAAGKSSYTFTATASPQVGYWTFNSHTGNTTPDSSNTGNIGNLVGGVTWGKGFDGNSAIILDGSTGYMSVPATPTFGLGILPVSLTAWVCPPQNLPVDNEGEIYPIATIEDGSVDGLSLCLRGGGHGIEARINTASGVVQVDTPFTADGYWHQVGFIYDGNGNVSLVLDGKIVTTQSGIQMASVASPLLWLGKDSAGHYFNGSIDEVELRRDVLTPAILLTKYNVDSNSDGMADWWEWKYFKTLNVAPTADTDGDGVSNLQEYLNGTDPTDYYNGNGPVITKVSGDNQNGVRNGFLSQVSDTNGAALSNVPVTFTVQSGGGFLALASSTTAQLSSTLALRTGTDGRATAYYQEGLYFGVNSQIQVTAGKINSVFTATASPLVAQWNFDEGSGVTAGDSSNTGNPCALNGGVAWTAGYDGHGAVTLDGSSGYLSTASSPSLFLSRNWADYAAISFSTWVRLPQNLPLDNANEIYPIITMGDNANDYVYLAIRGGGHGVEAAITGDTNTVINAVVDPSVLANGDWHQIGFSYNGYGTSIIVVDGIQVVTLTGFRGPALGSTRVWVGRNMAGNYFKGSIDKTEILHQPLQEADFQTLYVGSMYSPTPMQTISGSAFVSSTGQWMTLGSPYIVDINRRGSVDYSFSVPTSGIWAFQLAAQPIGNVSGVTVNIPVDVLVDDVLLGHYTLSSYNGTICNVTGLTQNLPAGDHTIRIVDWNPSGACNLQINTINILQPAGTDQDGNGTPDWVTQKIQNTNSVTPPSATSLTSPVCIEGAARLLQLTSIVSGTQTQGVQAGVNGKWYADVALNEDGSQTSIVTNLEGGLISSTNTVVWSALNIADPANANLVIRKGDSLRLTGYTPGSQATGPVTLTVTSGTNIMLNEQTTADVPVVCTFATSGTYTVQANWNGTQSGTLTLQVKAATFGNPIVAYINNAQVWQIPGLSSDLSVEWDRDLNITETTPPTTGGRSFQILPLVSGTEHGIARLTPGGPILSQGTVQVANIYNAIATGDSVVIQDNPDGSQLVQSSIAINALPPGGCVVIQIYIAGAAFEDGTTQKTLTAADFNNGIATFDIEWDNSHSVCHHVFIYNAQGQQIGYMY